MTDELKDALALDEAKENIRLAYIGYGGGAKAATLQIASLYLRIEELYCEMDGNKEKAEVYKTARTVLWKLEKCSWKVLKQICKCEEELK